MVAVVKGSVSLVTVSVFLVLVAKTAAKAFAQYCAVSTENTSTVSVNATPAGRARNVHYVTTSARSQTARVMDIAPMESVTASEATRVNSVKKWTVHIQLALDTDSALKALAFVKKAGKELTAARWTRKLYSAYPDVVDMAVLILRLRAVFASQCGQEMIAQKVNNFKRNSYLIK